MGYRYTVSDVAELNSRLDALEAENAKMRAALKKCTDKLEACAIASGTDAEFAAIAVKEFRDLLT